MSDLQNAITVLGKPYSITKSRLGAITQVKNERYICDLEALKELVNTVGEKLASINNIVKQPEFSFLISFDDQTHHDGVIKDFIALNTIPIGKETDRVVLRWTIHHLIDDLENTVEVTVRISNPVNPLVYLQAALSKSAQELDNMDYEIGSTCITVDGAAHGFADEIFLRVSNWIKARNKPHPYVSVGELYKKYEWLLDNVNKTLMPILVVALVSFYCLKNVSPEQLIALNPLIICIYFAMQPLASKVNRCMENWAKRSMYISLFQITNGDNDALTRLSANAKNGFLKLLSTTIISFILNIAAGVVCWKLTTG